MGRIIVFTAVSNDYPVYPAVCDPTHLVLVFILLSCSCPILQLKLVLNFFQQANVVVPDFRIVVIDPFLYHFNAEDNC
jgi:hypothetical protein